MLTAVPTIVIISVTLKALNIVSVEKIYLYASMVGSLGHSINGFIMFSRAEVSDPAKILKTGNSVTNVKRTRIT